MLTNEKQEQLKMFFLNQSTNFGLLSDQYITLFDIISKILQDCTINMLFSKIIFPDLGNVMVSHRGWIEEVLKEFLLSNQCKEIFELQMIQNTDGEATCIKLIPSQLKKEQFHRLEDVILKDIIGENMCSVSKIKSELEDKLNRERELKLYLKPILIRLIGKDKNFEEKICLMAGDLVRFLRRIKSLESWKDSNSGEIYFALTPTKLLYNNQQLMLSAYLQHNTFAVEHQQNNNRVILDDSFSYKQQNPECRLRCFST